MTEQEALEILIRDDDDMRKGYFCLNDFTALEVAKNALERQIAKKPEITRISGGIKFGICPNCGTEIDCLDNPFYHKDADCLQKLDWSEV